MTAGRPMPWSGPLLRPVTAVLCAVGLAGCAGLPVPRPPQDEVAPAVTPDQAQRIGADVAEVVAGAGAAPGWDGAVAANRLGGPCLEWATFAAAAGQPPPPGAVPSDGPPDVVVAPRTGTWPRAFAMVGGGDAPVLGVYVNDGPRTAYRLWAAMPVLAGEVVPSFAPADEGAAAPTPQDAPSGQRSLADVVSELPERYVDVLALGDGSVFAPEFAADGFAAALATRTQTEREALGEVAEVGVTHEVLRGDGSQPPVVLAVLTESGDALVVAGFRTTVTAVARPGTGVIGVPPPFQGVVGASSVTGTLTTVSVAALAFVVPAISGNIRVVAAADGITGVAAS